MIRFARATLAALGLTLALCGAALASPAGDWLGTLTVQPGLDLRIAVHLRQPTPTTWSATWDSVDQGIFDDPVSDLTVSDADLTFKIATLNASYAGKWDPAAKRWNGQWSQAGRSFALNLAPGAAPPGPTIAGLDGEWDGTLAMGSGLNLRLALHIAPSPHGTQVTFDSVDQGAYGSHMSSISRTGDAVRIESKLGGIVMEGALVDGGQTLAFRFTQGAMVLPLNLKRLPPGAASPWPAPAKTAAAPPPATTTDWKVPSDAEIRALLVQRIDTQHQGVGIVVGVISPAGRRIVAYGARDQGDARPLDGDTLFEIGSITKVFTAITLADMVRRGEVTLDDPAQKYLPAGVHMPTRGGHDSSLRRVPAWNLPALAGAGALRSSANDLLTFLAANLGYTETPLKDDLAAVLAVRRATGAPAVAQALGWEVLPLPQGEIVEHGGGTGGYHTFLAFNAKTRTGVVILTNAETIMGGDDIALHILTGSPVASLPPPPPPPPERHAIILSPAAMDALVGRYQLSPAVTVTVTRDGARLLAQLTGQAAFEIFPETPTTFFWKVVDAQATFQLGPGGQATSLTLRQNGRDLPAPRVPECIRFKNHPQTSPPIHRTALWRAAFDGPVRMGDQSEHRQARDADHARRGPGRLRRRRRWRRPGPGRRDRNLGRRLRQPLRQVRRRQDDGVPGQGHL